MIKMIIDGEGEIRCCAQAESKEELERTNMGQVGPQSSVHYQDNGVPIEKIAQHRKVEMKNGKPDLDSNGRVNLKKNEDKAQRELKIRKEIQRLKEVRGQCSKTAKRIANEKIDELERKLNKNQSG